MGKKLLILGAGGHGKVVREVAMSIKDETTLYDSVDFLDDNFKEAIGKIEELEKWKDQYDEVFCGIGNNAVRQSLLKKAEQLGMDIPVLIHPTAYISPTACIEKGTIVEPKAIVNANSYVKAGCIISVGAIVDHDVVVEEFAHINAGAICKAGSHIESMRKLEAGEVAWGYGVKKNDLEENWVKEHIENCGEKPGFF